jgi:outer membrane protein W
MRGPIFIAASCLLFVVATASAQQRSAQNSVTIFVSDLALSDLRSLGERSNAGYGVALDHMFTGRISGELSVSRQTYRRHVTTFVITGLPVSSFPEFALYPVDADVSYHFGSSSHWKPYAGVGIRYEEISVDLSSPLKQNVVTSRAVAPELVGGLTFQFRPDLGIRLDVRQAVRSERSYITKPVFYGLDQPSFAPAFKASLGLSVRF